MRLFWGGKGKERADAARNIGAEMAGVGVVLVQMGSCKETAGTQEARRARGARAGGGAASLERPTVADGAERPTTTTRPARWRAQRAALRKSRALHAAAGREVL